VGVALWKSLGLAMPALLRRSDGSEALRALFRGALDCAGLADGAADGVRPENPELPPLPPFTLTRLFAVFVAII
jgi:hypothetical protein